METHMELKIGDRIRYAYDDFELGEIAYAHGVVYDIDEEYAYADMDEFDGDLEIDDNNCYFVEVLGEE